VVVVVVRRRRHHHHHHHHAFFREERMQAKGDTIFKLAGIPRSAIASRRKLCNVT
jgi:hypothetical protein